MQRNNVICYFIISSIEIIRTLFDAPAVDLAGLHYFNH